jgi:hypothetical protein
MIMSKSIVIPTANIGASGFENTSETIERDGIAVTVSDDSSDRNGDCYWEGDGPCIFAERRDGVEPTYGSAEGRSAFCLCLVTEIVGAIGRGIAVADGADGGAQFETPCGGGCR